MGTQRNSATHNASTFLTALPQNKKKGKTNIFFAENQENGKYDDRHSGKILHSGRHPLIKAKAHPRQKPRGRGRTNKLLRKNHRTSAGKIRDFP